MNMKLTGKETGAPSNTHKTSQQKTAAAAEDSFVQTKVSDTNNHHGAVKVSQSTFQRLLVPQVTCNSMPSFILYLVDSSAK